MTRIIELAEMLLQHVRMSSEKGRVNVAWSLCYEFNRSLNIAGYA